MNTDPGIGKFVGAFMLGFGCVCMMFLIAVPAIIPDGPKDMDFDRDFYSMVRLGDAVVVGITGHLKGRIPFNRGPMEPGALSSYISQAALGYTYGDLIKEGELEALQKRVNMLIGIPGLEYTIQSVRKLSPNTQEK